MTEEQHARETNGRREVPKRLTQYYLGLLMRGERWNVADGDVADLLQQHLAYLRRQIEAGRYVFAGPVNTEDEEYVGMLMIRAESPQAALHIAELDPGVQAGRMRVRLLPVLLPSLDDVQVLYT